jgi:arylsulfatase A-like enzyme
MMNRRRFLKVCAASGLAATLPTGCSMVNQHHAPKAPPNIVVFLVDDMGLMDTSAPMLADEKGRPVKHPLNQWYRTPNMERLAEKGIRFNNFYAHSVCSPTRVSIMTGQNSARHRTTNWISAEQNNRTRFGPPKWNWEGLKQGDTTLAALLQQRGYYTIHVGKAHFGPNGHTGSDPLNLGFDVNIGGSSAGQPGSYYGQDGYGHIGGNKRRAVPHLKKYHGSETYLTETLTLEANAAIAEAAQANKPFFLHMAHYAVHAPFHSDPRFAAHYTDSDKKPVNQAFATMIEGMDKSLGDIVAQLERLGIADNTLILFLGDNCTDARLGPKYGHENSAPLRGIKGTHYEGGMRVPFIAAWAKPNPDHSAQRKWPIKAGALQPQMGTVMDLFPTICSLTQTEVPADQVLDGVDLMPQLADGHNQTRPECFLNHFPHGNHRSNYFTSYVEGMWKVIYHYPIEGAERYELFNLEQDPYETDNLAATHPEQLRRMMQALTNQLQQMNALYPVKAGQELKPRCPE